jgi:hypothetical protein
MKLYNPVIGGIRVLVLLVLLAATCWPTSPSQFGQKMHASTPAGYEVIKLQPSGAVLSLLGLIECPEIEGAQQVSRGLHSRVVLPDGAQLREFPRHFSFRVTASLRKTVLDPPSKSMTVGQDPEDVLLGLKFKLRAYHALDSRQIFPESVSMIGVPADIPYDERVFRVSFDVGDRAVADRFVLDVYSLNGEWLGRFPFELL